MSIAIVHDWILTVAGAEAVLAEMARLFPAPIHTLFSTKKTFAGCKVRSSLLNPMRRFYRHLLPLYSQAIKRCPLQDANLILSSSHAVAKNIRKREDQLHICYCHTPMRYIWDLEEEYRKLHELDHGIKGMLVDPLFARLRRKDLEANVDYFIANSKTVAERIRRLYNREAQVIYPPVAVENYPLIEKKQEFYLAYSRLVPYKRIDLVVKAFAKMPNKRLVVMGSGPEEKKLRGLAGPNVTFLGWQENPADVLGRARALIFPAFEDFGIIPVEAMSSGTPVIAFGKGGATETVLENQTGLFFYMQTPEAIAGAIEEFEEKAQLFDPLTIHNHAKQFCRKRFAKEYSHFVQGHFARWRRGETTQAPNTK